MKPNCGTPNCSLCGSDATATATATATADIPVAFLTVNYSATLVHLLLQFVCSFRPTLAQVRNALRGTGWKATLQGDEYTGALYLNLRKSVPVHLLESEAGALYADAGIAEKLASRALLAEQVREINATLLRDRWADATENIVRDRDRERAKRNLSETLAEATASQRGN